MSKNELIVSRENDPLVALGMTGASFDGAQRARITRIEADTDAMQYIARHIGHESLPPLVVITRDSSDARSVIGRWDDLLPVHQGSPNTGRFFAAGHLDRQMPGSANRELFVKVAKDIGAHALTEISISSWLDDTTHARDFATGLLLGQRPLDLPPKPSLLGMVGNFLTPNSQALDTIRSVRTDSSMPAPFIITTSTSTSDISSRR